MKPKLADSQKLKNGIFLILSFLAGSAFTLLWTNDTGKQIVSIKTSVDPLATTVQRVHEVQAGAERGSLHSATTWLRHAPGEAALNVEHANVSWEGLWVGTESISSPTRTSE